MNLTEIINKLKEELETEVNKYKNCGFEYNHYTRDKDKKLVTHHWICGKQSETCPHCKNNLRKNQTIKKLKAKLQAIQEIEPIIRQEVIDEICEKIEKRIKQINQDYDDNSLQFGWARLLEELKQQIRNQSQQEIQAKGESPISLASELDNGKYAMKSLSKHNPADTNIQGETK